MKKLENIVRVNKVFVHLFTIFYSSVVRNILQQVSKQFKEKSFFFSEKEFTAN